MFNYIAAWSKTKKYTLLGKLLASIANAFALFTAGKVLASMPVFVTIFRNTVCFNKDKFKSNRPIYFVLLAYAIIAVYTLVNMSRLVDILPLILSIVATLSNWFGTTSHIKVVSSISCSVWIIYFMLDGIYLTAVFNIIQVIIELTTILRIKIKGEKQHEKIY